MGNPDRRDQLRDAAIEVLAEHGGRGLTHRAVDAAAGTPTGTAKNYFPTRDALLRAVAERCVQLYRQIARPVPTGRESLVAMLRALVENVAGPGRPRLLAYLELQAEAARKPWLATILDAIAAADFADFERAQHAAGLPVTSRQAAAVTLAMHAAILHLLANGHETLAAAGLDDPDRFVRDLLKAVYGVSVKQEDAAAGDQARGNAAPGH